MISNIRNGECERLFKDIEWSASALGPQTLWPPELRTLTSVMLGSLQPMLIVWGQQQITLYNDGYAAMCGNRHPGAFGQPFRELWHDIWGQVEPIITAAYEGRGRWPDCRIVVISGRHRPDTGSLPEDAEFLTKPVGETELFKALEQLGATA